MPTYWYIVSKVSELRFFFYKGYKRKVSVRNRRTREEEETKWE